MAIKSDNVKGNPYHDEGTGEFTSAGSNSQKVLNKMGISNVSFDKRNFSLFEIIPKTNYDGSKRIFVKNIKNRMKFYQKWKQIYEMATMSEDGKSDIQPTILNNSPDRLKMREALKNEELLRQEKEPKKYERNVTIVFGLPASGKTFISNKFLKENRAYEIDSDIFSSAIPEFKKNHNNLSSVHAEATVISKNFMQDIIKKGGNMVIGKVGGDPDLKSLTKLFDTLAENGYKINLVINDLPVEKSLERNLQRHKSGEPRLVPSFVPIVADLYIHDNFEKLLQHNNVVSASVYSSDTPLGEGPRLLKEFKKGE